MPPRQKATKMAKAAKQPKPTLLAVFNESRVLFSILNFLSPNDCRNLRQACKTARDQLDGTVTHVELEASYASCAVTALASGRFRTLVELDISECGLGPEVAQVLSNAGKAGLPLLRSLKAEECDFGPTGAAALVTNSGFTFEELLLGHCGLGPQGAFKFPMTCAASSLQILRVLGLSGNAIGPDGAKALASTSLPQLEELDLSDNALGPFGGAHIGTSGKNWPELRVLNLAMNELGDKGVQLLVQHYWKYLEEVDLSNNGIKYHGMQSLASSEKSQWRWVKVLRLNNNKIPPSGAGALGKERFPLLRELDLSGNDIKDEGVKRLTDNAAAYFPNLETLLLRNAGLSAQGLARSINANWLSMKAMDLRQAGTEFDCGRGSTVGDALDRKRIEVLFNAKKK